MAKGKGLDSFLAHRARVIGAGVKPEHVHKSEHKRSDGQDSLFFYFIKFPGNVFYYFLQKGEKLFWRSRTGAK